MSGPDRESDKPRERDLRRWFAEHPAPQAPPALREFLHQLPTDHPTVERLRPTVATRGPRGRRVRGLRFLVMAAALALLTVASGALLFSGQHGPSTATPSPGSTLGATRSATPTSGLPQGVTVIDTANVIRRVKWSPDGRYLAVSAQSGTSGLGAIDIFAADGRQVDAYPGYDFAWGDSAHLLTIGDLGTAAVTVHTIGDPGADHVVGTFSGLLGNGHGSVALTDAPLPNGWAGGFHLWTTSALGPDITGHGFPVAWSPDGHLLALFRPLTTSEMPFTLAAAGSASPATVVVLRFPGATPLPLIPAQIADMRTLVTFSPDSGWLALDDGPDVLVYGMQDGKAMRVQGDAALDWSPDGRLLLRQRDGSLVLRDASGDVADAGLPPGAAAAAYGPTTSEVAVFQEEQQGSGVPQGSVTVSVAGLRVTVPVQVIPNDYAWAPGGSAFYVPTGSTDVQAGDDKLLRISIGPSAATTATPAPSPSPLPVVPGFTAPAPTATGATWTSLTWTKFGASDSLALVRQVVHAPAGYLALGDPMTVANETVTPLWFSAAGVTWQTIPPSALGEAPFVLAIGQTGGNLVALTAAADTSGCFDNYESNVCLEPTGPITSWTSTDGQHWSAHPGPDLGPSGLGPGALLASGPAGLVAFESSGGTLDSTVMAISPDGIVWKSVPSSGFPAYTAVRGMVGTATGYVAVGARTTTGQKEAAVALWSADGWTWTPTSGLPITGQSTGVVEAASSGVSWSAGEIVAASDGFIAVGGTGAVGGGSTYWWHSADGHSWQVVSGFPPLGPTTCVGEGCGGSPDGLLTGDGARMIALRGAPDPSEPSVKPGAWTSIDGTSWLPMAMSGELPSGVQAYLLPMGVLVVGNGAQSPAPAWFGAAATK
jgi:hypothetical protein